MGDAPTYYRSQDVAQDADRAVEREDPSILSFSLISSSPTSERAPDA